MVAGNVKCCTVVLTMDRVIWLDMRKVRVEAEAAYGSYIPSVMVGQYIGNSTGA